MNGNLARTTQSGVQLVSALDGGCQGGIVATGYLLIKMRQGEVIEVHQYETERKVVVAFPTEVDYVGYNYCFKSDTLNIGDTIQEICKHEQDDKLLKADAVLHTMWP